MSQIFIALLNIACKPEKNYMFGFSVACLIESMGACGRGGGGGGADRSQQIARMFDE